jgi:hypothetical protein
MQSYAQLHEQNVKNTYLFHISGIHVQPPPSPKRLNMNKKEFCLPDA